MTANPRPRLASNALWLGAAQIAVVALSFGLTLAISRWLGAASLGQWRLAQAITSYLLVFTDAGLSALAIREIARDPSRTDAFGTPIVAVQLLAATTLFTLLVALIQLLALPTDTAWLTLLLASTVFPQTLSLGHVLQGREQMSVVAKIRMATQLASTVGGIVLLAATHQLVWVVPPILIATLAADGAMLAYVRRRFAVTVRLPKSREMLRLSRGAAPFLVSAIAIQLIMNADVLLIAAFSGVAELGLYAAPYAIVAQLLALGGPLMMAAFPRLAGTDGPATMALLRRLCSFLGYFVLPAAIGLALTSDLVVRRLFGPAYEQSGPVLALLVSLPLFGYHNMAVGQTLGASRHQTSVMVVSLLAAGINIGMNLVLIPRFGISGAAVAVIGSEVASAVAFSFLLRRFLAGQVLTAYFQSLPSAALMAIGLIGLRQANVNELAILVAVGAPIYGLSSLVLPSFGRHFVRRLIASHGHRG
jgi:O-antigen/teichoic acid export membrane protein